jgi:prepilin-type N-terminal cleavage/methylation domain-containing protein
MSSIRNNFRVLSAPISRAHRGFSLAELMLALTIVSLLSVSVAMLLAGAGDTDFFVNRETQAMAQVETAYRRILHNVRTASAISVPSTTTAGTTLTLQTQPDPGNSNNPWTVTYKILSGNLVEDDPRYDSAGSTPNILVSNVKTFSVTRSATAAPTTITLTIISNTSPPVTRTAVIECRNF